MVMIKIPQVYVITNNVNGKVYIGKTNHLKTRWNAHKLEANKSKYKTAIYNAMRKYGVANFTIEVVAYYSSDEEMLLAEKYWISEMRKHLGIRNVYNETDGGDGLSGHKRSEAFKKLQSERRKGVKASPETRKKLSDSHKGYEHTEQQKMKIGNHTRGRTWKVVDGIRVWFNKEDVPPGPSGWRPTAEQRERNSIMQKGKKRSPETRKKLSESATARYDRDGRKPKKIPDPNKPPNRTGQTNSPEHRRAISEAMMGEKHWAYGKPAHNTGSKHTEETIKKLSTPHSAASIQRMKESHKDRGWKLIDGKRHWFNKTTLEPIAKITKAERKRLYRQRERQEKFAADLDAHILSLMIHSI